jgi:hypothetical protein
MTTERMIRFPLGQQGAKLLPDGLDDVWLDGGHRVGSLRSGSLENSPDDGISRARFSYDFDPYCDGRSNTLRRRRLRRVDLLIHDELGFIPLGELLFDQLSERNETRSTLLTTNLSFGEWVQVFGDEKRTIALLDRLGRHAHVLTTRGESYRTRKRRRKEEPKVAP